MKYTVKTDPKAYKFCKTQYSTRKTRYFPLEKQFYVNFRSIFPFQKRQNNDKISLKFPKRIAFPSEASLFPFSELLLCV